MKSEEIPIPTTTKSEKRANRNAAEALLAQKTEELIAKAGAFGWYQILYLFASQISNFFFAVAAFSVNFNVLKPHFSCYGHENTTSCTAFDQCPNNLTIATDHGFWSLGCEWPHLVKTKCRTGSDPLLLVATATQIAEGLGSVVGGVLSDKYGRKSFLLGGMLLATIFLFFASLANNFTDYLILFILSIFMTVVSTVPAITLGNEYTLSKDRLLMSFGHNWGIGYFIVAIGAYYTRSWRKYLGYGCLFGLTAIFLFLGFEESPRWLLAKGRYDKAADALNIIAKKNKKDVVFDKGEIAADFREVEVLGIARFTWWQSIQQLIRHKPLVIFASVYFSYRFLFLLMFSVVTFNFDQLFTSPYMSMAIMGAIRVWAPVVLVVLDQNSEKFSRKRFLLLSFTLVAVPIVFGTILQIIAEYSTDDQQKSKLKLAMTVCMLAATSLNAGMLYYATLQIALEVFPTIVRNQLCGISSVFASLGGALGAQLLLLQDVWLPMPSVIVSVATIVCFALCMHVMPETKGKPLPDTFEDLKIILD